MPKIWINGMTREMTEDEVRAFETGMANILPPEPTPEERLAKLEEENAHLKEALNLLLEGVTDDG